MKLPLSDQSAMCIYSDKFSSAKSMPKTIVAGKVHLVKTEASGLIPPSALGFSPVLLLQHPMKRSPISHHTSPARATSPGSSAHPPPVLTSPTLHFGISQQGRHLGIMVSLLHRMAVVHLAHSEVHLGLASLQCSKWRHRDPL